MHPTRNGIRFGIVGLAMVSFMLTGCSQDVSQSDVEEEIEKVYSESGSTIEDVSCDGSLAGEVDATQDCTATIDGVETELVTTVTEVDGGTVNFDIDIAGAPEGEEPTDEPTESPSE